MAGRVRQRPGLAPARHPAVDQPRVARQRDVGAQPQPLHHAGPEALDQHVGALSAGQRERDPGRRLQVERERACGRAR